MDNFIWQALFLGIIQGLTEFLPISSSAHLAIFQKLLPGFEQPGILLDVLLHFGTLLAVALYFNRDLKNLALDLMPAGLSARAATGESAAPGWRLLVGIIVASVPTAIIGLTLEAQVEQMFDSLSAVGIALIGTAVLLVMGDLAARRRGESQEAEVPGIGQSLVIGVFQGLAVIPGLSRSGATISAGLMLGVSGVAAARFSFLLSIPAVAGAFGITLLKHLSEVRAASAGAVLGSILGMAAAAGVGYACIGWMMRLMKQTPLRYFAVYCAALGLALVASQWIGRG